MSPNEKEMISLKMNSIHDSRKQIKIPWKIKWGLKDEPGATQCILGVNDSPSMRLLQDEVKKKKTSFQPLHR